MQRDISKSHWTRQIRRYVCTRVLRNMIPGGRRRCALSKPCKKKNRDHQKFEPTQNSKHHARPPDAKCCQHFKIVMLKIIGDMSWRGDLCPQHVLDCSHIFNQWLQSSVPNWDVMIQIEKQIEQLWSSSKRNGVDTARLQWEILDRVWQMPSTQVQ